MCASICAVQCLYGWEEGQPNADHSNAHVQEDDFCVYDRIDGGCMHCKWIRMKRIKWKKRKEKKTKKRKNRERTTKRKYMKSQKVNTQHNSFIPLPLPFFGVCSILCISRTNGIRWERPPNKERRNERTDKKMKTEKKTTKTHTKQNCDEKKKKSKPSIREKYFPKVIYWPNIFALFSLGIPECLSHVLCVWPFHLVVFHLNFTFSVGKIDCSVPIFFVSSQCCAIFRSLELYIYFYCVPVCVYGARNIYVPKTRNLVSKADREREREQSREINTICSIATKAIYWNCIPGE